MSKNLINKLTWNYDDYCALPDDLNRHEIIEGEHYVTPSPSSRHQRISINMAAILKTHIDAQNLGTLLAAPIDVLLSPTSVVQPDLVFIKREHEYMITDPNIQGAPDLVVEILSHSTAARDRGNKMLLYAKFGVPHYWIVNPDPLSLSTYQLAAGEYGLTAQFGRGNQAQSPLFQGLIIPVENLER
jgi:Uma2 family endonuclease